MNVSEGTACLFSTILRNWKRVKKYSIHFNEKQTVMS